MLLVLEVDENADELRADFQQYYGLNIDDMGLRGFSYAHAATLLAQLPKTSRVAIKRNPDNAWDEQARILVHLEYDLRRLMWSMTKDAQYRRNEPKPLPSPSERRLKDKRIEGANKELVDKILGR